MQLCHSLQVDLDHAVLSHFEPSIVQLFILGLFISSANCRYRLTSRYLVHQNGQWSHLWHVQGSCAGITFSLPKVLFTCSWIVMWNQSIGFPCWPATDISHCLRFCSHSHELWCATSLLAFHVGLPLIYLLRSISLVTAQERYAFIQWGGTLSSCSPLLNTLDIPWMYWLLRRQIIVIDIFSFTVATITLWCIWKSCCPHILVFYLVRLIPPWRLQCMVVWAFSHLKETWDASVGSKQQRKEREGFSDELLTSLQIFCWRYYWFRRIWSSWLPPPDSRGTIDKAVFWGEIIIANIIFCTVASIYFVVYL